MPLALPSLSYQLHGLAKYTISLKVRTQKHQSPFFLPVQIICYVIEIVFTFCLMHNWVLYHPRQKF